MDPTHSPAAALRTALELFETGVEIKRESLKREYPEATDSEIDERLRQWLHYRPGAEQGDCPGRVVDLGAKRA
jgi:hypothetical protein